jgi:cysteine desulfurase / selenocysteine lyase
MEIIAHRAADDILSTALSIAGCRHHFPVLRQWVNGKPLVYLDNAATSQKPQVVIDAMMRYYESENSNIHRGVHYLSERATEAYEGVRQKVARFVNAPNPAEIIFVRGTTEAVNLVSYSYGRKSIGPGDEVVISAMEHHSNIVPWQMVCEEKGARLRVIPMDDRGVLQLDEYENLLNERTKIVAVVHVSNALGTINPVKEMIATAHRRGIPVLVDGAQAVPHMKVDVQELDCDFYAFSAHKMFGPTGVGVLYGKTHHLAAMPPYQGGGDMIKSVTFEKTIYNDLPYKFEAGTPNIGGGIGLGAAVDYLVELDMDAVAAHERDLLLYATAAVQQIPGVHIIGTAPAKAGVLSFVIDGIHPHDIGSILDDEGIAIRTGHHCAQPVMKRFGVPATARASFAFYNTKEEIDALVRGIDRVKEVLG